MKPQNSLAGSSRDISSLRPRLSSATHQSTPSEKLDPKEALEKLGPRPSKELRKEISKQITAKVEAPRLKPLGQPQGLPPSPIEPHPILLAATKPMDLLRQMEEFSGLGIIRIGSRVITGACLMVAYMKQNLAVTIEITLPHGETDPVPDMPSVPLPVVCRYSGGFLYFEIPGWGSFELLPGDLQFQSVFASAQAIERVSLAVRASTIFPNRAKLPTILVVFSSF